MMNSKSIIAIIMISASIAQTSAALCLRFVGDDWSHNQLHEKSDLIAVVIPLDTTDIDRVENDREPAVSEKPIRVRTEVTVQSVIKGAPMKQGGKINIAHHRLSPGFYANPPRVAVFRKEKVEIKVREKTITLEPHPYLVFLKKIDGSHFEPITGVNQEEESILELIPANGKI